MANTPLKIGLLGLGNMGRNHLRILSMLKSVDLQFIYDANPDVRSAMAAQYGASAVDAVDESLLEGLDALVVVTPTNTHADYIEMAAGKVPYLFVEKPLTDSLAKTERMVALARERGTKIQAGFIERFNPAVQVLRKVTEGSERINTDLSRTSKMSCRITDVDVVVDLMIHDLDLAIYLNGPVRDVSAHGVVADGLIGFACATLTHESGVFSRVQASRITDKKRRLIEVTCADKFVSCDLLRKEVLISSQSNLRDCGGAYAIGSAEESVLVPQQEALLSELNAFVQACSDGDFTRVPVAGDDLEVMRVVSTIQSQILGA